MHTIKNARRLVIKIGSALLIDDQDNQLRRQWLLSLIEDIATCWKRGQKVIIVSSGAIALGRNHLTQSANLQLEQKQAAAAIGQIRLAHAYQEALAEHNITVAQILLTLDDSENRQRYLNAKNTLETLLNAGVIPVINENDTVATAEIRFGDNDRLAARVAQMVSADTLVLLSDIDGLYTADPRQHPEAKFIPEVKELSPEILAMAGGASSAYGSGGMITKLAAAKIALASGCHMVIAEGKYLNPLNRIDDIQKNTWFIASTSPIRARKNWLAQHLKPSGSITIDDGALSALQQGKSLLSIGVTQIVGEFDKGAAVAVLSGEQQEIGRGLINFSARDAKKIMGHPSQKIQEILGYDDSPEMIHRDDLVIY